MLWNPITLTIAAVLLLLLLMLLLSLHGPRIVAVTAIAEGEVTHEEKFSHYMFSRINLFSQLENILYSVIMLYRYVKKVEG